MTTITSTQNERVKLIRALQSQAKARRQEGKIALEGVRLISDALRANAIPDFALFDADALNVPPLAALRADLSARHVPCLEATSEVFAHAADTETPQGVIAVLSPPQMPIPNEPRLLLILDAIGDPGNLGTMIRTAAAAAADGVIFAPNCADPYNPKALRAGMGAHFRVAHIAQAWAAIHAQYGTLPFYLADSEGELAYTQVDWTQPAALIIGSEANGATEMARRLASRVINIPMANQSESLNAAAAAAVILFEARRQRAV